MFRAYIEKRLSAQKEQRVREANTILQEYADQGFDLTLRQLYYQFVARGLIPNNQREYKNLGAVINDARLLGLIDWECIVDRTRNVDFPASWSNPNQIIYSAARSYRIDPWDSQDVYVEVWIEKDALRGVIEGVCEKYRVPNFACRGYVSQSELWRASQRMIEKDHRSCIVVHLGDHDPSGIDMTRDIAARFELFGAEVDVRRIALNGDQVELYKPPPNPAKLTDSRASDYVQKHGWSSWELDALSPRTIHDLIESEVTSAIDFETWDKALQAEEEDREDLQKAAYHWSEVSRYVKSLRG